jgi:hypothetical protein
VKKGLTKKYIKIRTERNIHLNIVEGCMSKKRIRESALIVFEGLNEIIVCPRAIKKQVIKEYFAKG